MNIRTRRALLLASASALVLAGPATGKGPAGVDDDVIVGGTEDGTMEFFGVTGSGASSTTCPDASCDRSTADRVPTRSEETPATPTPDARDRTPDLVRGGGGRDRATIDAVDEVIGVEEVVTGPPVTGRASD